jgi:hypothetical protein
MRQINKDQPAQQLSIAKVVAMSSMSLSKSSSSSTQQHPHQQPQHHHQLQLNRALPHEHNSFN